MLEVVFTNRFKKDYKLAKKQGKDLNKFDKVYDLLVSSEEIPLIYKDHLLTGNYIPCRELHLEPDWLLVYCIDKEKQSIYFVRLGSHSNLFDGSYKLPNF